VTKVLTALSKKHPNIASWARSISNHLWFAAQNCNEDEDELIRIWSSLFHHVQDEHEWLDSNGECQSCSHGELCEEERDWKQWLTEDEVQVLRKVNKNKLI
jgi:hypothetical protein